MQEKGEKKIFFFGKQNLILIIGGFLLSIIGFMLMSGGASEDPNTFNADEVFSTRRITLAPLVVIVGYIVVIIGIMKKPKK